jgi:hypothetical protein
MSSSIERDSVMAVLHSKRVWLVHLMGNALLFAAFFYWLQIKEETGAWFAVTVMTGLMIVFFTLLLHGATFAYFRAGTDSSFASALRRVIPKLPWLLVWVVIFGLVLWLIGQLWDYSAQAGGWARHLLPEFMRKRVSPRLVISVASGMVWSVFFFLWPVMFLPVGAQTTALGLRGIFSGRAWRPIREFRFWIIYAACFLFGGYIPYKLAYMTATKASSLSAQTGSIVLRFGVGYLLLVTAWLVLSAAIMRAMADPEPAARESAGTMPLM